MVLVNVVVFIVPLRALEGRSGNSVQEVEGRDRAQGHFELHLSIYMLC